MHWLNSINKDGLKHDLIKVFTYMIIAHILLVKTAPNSDSKVILFDESFIKNTLYTLIGFAVFYIIIEPLLIGSKST